MSEPHLSYYLSLRFLSPRLPSVRTRWWTQTVNVLLTGTHPVECGDLDLRCRRFVLTTGTDCRRDTPHSVCRREGGSALFEKDSGLEPPSSTSMM